MTSESIIKFFDRLEVIAITIISKVVPILVPMIPGYVGFVHVTDKVTGLGFDTWAGWVYAAVVEGLGYAAIYKAVQFYEHNKKYTSEKNQAPLWGAVAIYISYLVVILAVNVVLDYKAGLQIYKVFTLGLISLLSVPAGFLSAISAAHTERVTERQIKNDKRGTNDKPLKTNSHRMKPSPFPNSPLPVNEQSNDFGFPGKQNDRVNNRPNNKAQLLLDYVEHLEAQDLPVPGNNELARRLNLSNSYVSTTLKNRGVK